jgi:two-component sensor histidine kinase
MEDPTMIVSSGEDNIVRPPPLSPTGRVRSSETDHRIANSLQLLSALLASQGRELVDPIARAALDVSVHRIGAIAGVHRQLYSSHEGGLVELSAYLADLVERLQSSFGCSATHRRIDLKADTALISSDFAGVLGIVVTELVINACKHAYGVDETGEIQVVWTIEPEQRFSLQVRDQGRGRNEDELGGGLGSQILELMARKIRAQADYVSAEAGTCFSMTGPLPSR